MYLKSQGVSEAQVIIEEKSRHTLKICNTPRAFAILIIIGTRTITQAIKRAIRRPSSRHYQ